MSSQPLLRAELRSVIDGKGAARRVPMLFDLWVHPWTFGEQEAEVRAIMAAYPMDACIIPIRMPGTLKAPDDDPGYRFMHKDVEPDSKRGHDAQVLLADMEEVDALIADFPNADYQNMYPEIPPEDGRYRLACWFYCLFERHWSLRGVENALTDFYEYPEETHRLYNALTEFYIRLLERAHDECGADGIFTSDDLGTQTGPFFSPEIFQEFFLPYYTRIANRAHELGMHFWMHCCGDVSLFLDMYVQTGIDVLHPIQKYAMDEKAALKKLDGRMCIWSGFDVQRIIPFGTPGEVRREVRFLIDTYYQDKGLLMLTAGNGVNQDCPLPSLRALYDEALTYGTWKAAQAARSEQEEGLR